MICSDHAEIDGRTVYVQEPVLADEQKISSSEMGRIYSLVSPQRQQNSWENTIACRGGHSKDARGRLLGFPTLNIKLPDKCLPLEGVYAGWIDHEGERLAAVANLGGQPTFGEGERPRLEVHVLDAQLPELYGTEVRFHFLERLRGLVRFEGPKALSAQLSLDTENARRCCSGAPVGIRLKKLKYACGSPSTTACHLNFIVPLPNVQASNILITKRSNWARKTPKLGWNVCFSKVMPV